ncbi:queuine tRNA-ribosyltransferase accessory subunit 2-like isoform X1 [Haliotis rubra]|uniref:queuine tRNA-ribosyltransferase accessory subunit 2-like isoform X1 n=2 Tax=Haliotis rubra TaxID=36100 RepID=UPI001EE5F800|nr:queuine tRNA-ribosyltransferase accessory subunit 2-like isoform X1 [Haliotis rubra]XP_046577463.1 queuine tRNA-ribosyltransferase accessory subunit 2-like isoform X1 [Haliotis rubra]
MKRDIMKFVVKSVTNGSCRLGTIENIGRFQKTVETPMCMLYTRGGSAPHLTRDMLHKIQDLPPVANMAVSMVAEHHEALKEYGQGMARFAAMQEFLVYTSLHDTNVEIPSGYNEKGGSAVWTKGGKMKIDVDLYMKIQSAVQPDWCQALCDHDTNAESSRKRAVKSVDRTLSFLDQILQKQSNYERLKNTEVFGVLEGGWNVAERERSAKETAARSVAGFVIEGFHSLGPSSETFKMSDIEEILQKTLNHLPDDKPRLMQSIWPPDEVLHAVQRGIDVFDSCYPYTVTERGGALIFQYDHHQPVHPESAGDTVTSTGYEISLKDKVYHDDFSPILKGCPCYTCQKFTKSYVNHLLNTSELLAGVLLMIHNFHHYFQFFKTIRQSLEEGMFESLKDLILKQKS